MYVSDFSISFGGVVSEPSHLQWIISDPDANDAQFITPVTAQSKAAAVGNGVVTVSPENTVVWTIRKVTSVDYT